MNLFIGIGRLTKEPEMKIIPNGIATTTFTIAITRTHTSQNEEKKVDYINCVAWNKQAENINKYCSKGSQVAVKGRIQVRSYKDTNGNNRYITEVICNSVAFLSSNSSSSSSSNSFNSMQNKTTKSSEDILEFTDDDLPFDSN